MTRARLLLLSTALAWASATACSSATDGGTADVTITSLSSASQFGDPGLEPLDPPRVKVTRNSAPVAGWPVDFTVLAGGGSVGAGSTSVRVQTDAQGVAQVVWILGQQAGTNRLRAALGNTSGTGQGQAVEFEVIAVDPLVITTASPLPAGEVGQAYSQALQATGGTGAYTWALGAGTSPPPGLTLGAGGVLSGTPTAAGVFVLEVGVTSGSVSTSQDFALSISAGPPVIVTSSPLPSGTVNQAYSLTLLATGGTGIYNWSMNPADAVPGLSLNQAGVLAGTPTAAGTYSLVIGCESGGQLTTETLTLVIEPGGGGGGGTINYPRPVPRGVVGMVYPGLKFTASGVPQPYTYATSPTGPGLLDDVPLGLSIDPTTGLLGGTPALLGTFKFKVEVRDPGGVVLASVAVTIPVVQ